jgi:4-amino-4-deoxychorismate lyase
MYRFVETLMWKQALMPLLTDHLNRMIRTCEAHHIQVPDLNDLQQELDQLNFDTDKLKLRILYGEQGYKILAQPYQKFVPERLYLLKADHIQYPYKYLDRQDILELKNQVPPDSDIIMLQDGLITDASYANLVFGDDHTWWTPRKPLFAGIRRQHLLQSGQIHEREIGPDDLKYFTRVGLINALLDLGESEQSIDKICHL